MDQEKLILSLIDRGWYACENFLSQDLCRALLSDLNNLELRPAKVGKGTAEQTQTEIRNDSIFWLDANQSPAQDQYLNKMNEIMSLMNREFFLGLKQFEGHYARYQKNGFYKKHTDQFIGNNERLVTAVSYLNTPEAGGGLRIYKRDNPEEVETDFAPKAGSLVCFLTSQIYHEVLPTTAGERYSIAGWFRTNIL